MDGNLEYLFAAFAVTWLAIAGYLLYVSQQVRALRDDLRSLDDDKARDNLTLGDDDESRVRYMRITSS
jgi:CcmD family protein